MRDPPSNLHLTHIVYEKMLRDREDLPRLARLGKEGKEIADITLPNANCAWHRAWGMGNRQRQTSEERDPAVGAAFSRDFMQNEPPCSKLQGIIND